MPAVSWVGCDVPTVTSGSASATTIHVLMRSGDASSVPWTWTAKRCGA